MSNRTEPLFQGTNNTNSVNLGLTTRCTMTCPKCSLGMARDKGSDSARHASIHDIKRDSEHMKGLRRVHLTGGEPTMHPDFDVIARHVREWFECEYVTIESNGAGYMKYRDVFATRFDKVFITWYLKDLIYPGNFDNTKIIEQAEIDLGNKLIREEPVTHDKEHILQIGNTKVKPCSKWFAPGLPAGWYNGLLYSCCVTYGIDPNLGIPVTPDWREKIKAASMGCESCLFLGT